MKKSVKFILMIIIVILIALFLIRLINPTEIDDVTPGISCPEIEIYNPEVLYAIPIYNNTPLSLNKTWCEEILNLNKTIELHGIHHTYHEFKNQNISDKELELGIDEFEKCFLKKPTEFKAPNLRINEQNKKLIEENNLIVKSKLNQITHKVYHCNNSGVLPNWIIDLI